jgi:predicted TIM-barrel fold metal-dependent hydrolase
MSGTSNPEWISLTHEEPVDPKRRIIDPHHHFWGADDCHDLGHAYPHEQLLEEMGGHNVVGSVYIECDAAWYSDGPEHLRPVGETASVAAQAKRTENSRAPIMGIVGYADLKLGDRVQEVLDAHAEAGNGLFKGTRLASVRTADVVGLSFDQILAKIRSRPVYTDPAYRDGIKRLGASGFSMDAFIISYQLPQFAELARDLPDMIFIANHIGAPMYNAASASDGDRQAVMANWREAVQTMAPSPNIFVKVGGLGMEAMFGLNWSKQPKPPTSDDVLALWGDDLRFLIDTIGPARCMFESNFPVDRHAVGYTVLWNAFQKLAASYSEAEQEDLFSGTAMRAYRL